MIVKNYVLYTSNQISLMSLFGAEVIWVVIFFYGEVVGGRVGRWQTFFSRLLDGFHFYEGINLDTDIKSIIIIFNH